MSTRRRISQREAYRMRKRIAELEYKLRDFGRAEERIKKRRARG